MKYIVLLAAVVAILVSVLPARGDDALFARAHRAAVRFRHQRDHLQLLLTMHVRAERRERRALLHRPDALDALHLAAVTYGVRFDTLYRKASCESTGSRPVYPPTARVLKADAKNRSSTAAGLGQFLDSTWASTPYAGFSVYDVFANALAMGWMHAHGRGGEWAASQGCWG